MFKIRFVALLTGLCLVSELAQAQGVWTKSDANPVLRRDTVVSNFPVDLFAISDPWVLKIGTEYKMWYTAGGFNYPADTLMRSRICYATSSDGINWEKYSGNPVLNVSTDGSWDSLGVETVSVIYDPAEALPQRYKMWYAGQYFNAYRYAIGYATSADGISWTKHPEPVLEVGAAPEWDNGFIEGPTVLKEAGAYKMWYAGYDATVDGSGTDGQTNIGLATSEDGINWTKYSGNPVFKTDPGAWDSQSVQDPHILLINGIYEMWYGGNNVEGYGQQVGWATSTDGIQWTRSSQNPVLIRGNPGEWDANTASFPSVIQSADNAYEMWYTGKDVAELTPGQLDYFWEIGYASSITTSADEVDAGISGGMKVFPNPSSSIFNIIFENTIDDAVITITDLPGRVIAEKQIQNTRKTTVILTQPAGIYLLTITSGEGQKTMRLLKL